MSGKNAQMGGKKGQGEEDVPLNTVVRKIFGHSFYFSYICARCA